MDCQDHGLASVSTEIIGEPALVLRFDWAGVYAEIMTELELALRARGHVIRDGG